MAKLKLVKKEWKDAVLQHSSLVSQGSGAMSTYDLHNGLILKRVKKLEDLETFSQMSIHTYFLESLEKKLNDAPKIGDKEIVVPKEVYYHDGQVEAYTVPKVEGVPIGSYLQQITSLEVYSDVMIRLAATVKKINRNGIILPDLANPSNVLVRPKDGSLFFIDYDGMQIQSNPSYSVSNMLKMKDHDMFMERKYQTKNNLHTSNLDKLSLLLLYIYGITGKNWMEYLNPEIEMFEIDNLSESPRKKMQPPKQYFEEIAREFSLENTELLEQIIESFDVTKHNSYPISAFEELKKTHTLKLTGNRALERKS